MSWDAPRCFHASCHGSACALVGRDAIGMDGRRGAEFGTREVEQRAGELRNAANGQDFAADLDAPLPKHHGIDCVGLGGTGVGVKVVEQGMKHNSRHPGTKVVVVDGGVPGNSLEANPEWDR
ncbi:hypothetical protein C8J57DRAFT_1242499 [Mycena rebaudengoi]|nr:hypothetical protein C8J57DRAFT_1242499 [Mycena rebaudengoi]